MELIEVRCMKPNKDTMVIKKMVYEDSYAKLIEKDAESN